MTSAGAIYGMQRLQDSQLAYKRTATPAYLRYKKFADIGGNLFAQLGFSIRPDPTTNATGTKDVLIDPPPTMSTLPLKNIGIPGGKLRYGAKSIMISSTFVDAQAALLGFDDPKLVFNQCLGIFNEKMLYSIEDIQHEMFGGAILNWILVCNANELR